MLFSFIWVCKRLPLYLAPFLSAGEWPETITDSLKLGICVHFSPLPHSLAHSCLAERHLEREKELGRTGPPFHFTTAASQWDQTGPSVEVMMGRTDLTLRESLSLSLSFITFNFFYFAFPFFSTISLSFSFSQGPSPKAQEHMKPVRVWKFGSSGNKQETIFITQKSEFDYGSWGFASHLAFSEHVYCKL